MLAEIRQTIADLPGIVWLRRQRHLRAMRRGADFGRFWGVFSSHDEALDGARQRSSGLAIGYNTHDVARDGRAYYEQMFLHDYPAAAWLLRFVWENSVSRAGDCVVVDLGGHLGEKFTVFRRIWPREADPSWVVLETTAAVETANALPDADRSPRLSFTDDRAVLDGAPILFASGSLQYLERDLWEILDDLVHPPPHLVLNKVPLSTGREFWTTQNAGGKAIVPYHVWNRDRFLGELTSRGYKVLDEWAVPDRSVSIPFHRDLGTRANSGISLTRRMSGE